MVHEILSSLESDFGIDQQLVDDGIYFSSEANHFKELCVNTNCSNGIVKEDSASENIEKETTNNHVAGHFQQNSTLYQIQGLEISESENQNFLSADNWPSLIVLALKTKGADETKSTILRSICTSLKAWAAFIWSSLVLVLLFSV